MKRFLQIVTLFITLLLPAYLYSQGTVTGVIKDASAGSTLPGAAITIQGTNYGTISNNFGQYTLTGVPEGKITLVYSYISYVDEFVEVEIKAGETKEINIELDVETIGVSEVVVTAQLLGQTKAINEQLNADGNVSVVSEEKMKELPDANAAEAIGRISGISLQRSQGEGSKVVVRGLEPRFSAITINGVKVPSNDAEDKSVDLSMISPELLQGIEVFKSPTPDMDAEAVGGTVNLRLNKAPDKPKFKLKAGSGYNFLRNDFSNYNLSGSYSRRFFENKFGVLLQANTERVNRSSDDIDPKYETRALDGVPTSVDLSGILRKTEEIRKRSGASINLDYALDKGNINLYAFYNSTNRDITQKRNFIHYKDQRADQRLIRREINADILSSMLSGTHAIGILKTDWSFSYSKTTNKRPLDYEARFEMYDIWKNELPADNSTLSTWFDEANYENDSSTILYEIFADTRDVSESNLTGALDFELPLSFGDDWSLTFKFGGKYNILDRVRSDHGSWERFYYLGLTSAPSWDPNYPYEHYIADNKMMLRTFTDPNYTGEQLLEQSYYNAIDPGKVDRWVDYFKNDFVNNRAKEVDNVTIRENIIAGYVMAKLKFRKAITVIPGFRYEVSDNRYDSKISSLSGWDNSLGTINDTTTSQKYSEFFPHLHIKIEPNNWYKLRLSAAKTLARPNYNYISYSAYIDNNNSTIRGGNPDLKHMTSMNYDLSMSFYSPRYGMLTVGGFYKDIKNIFYAVENLYLDSDSLATAIGWEGRRGYQLTTYQNSPEATVYGLEVDLQTNLKFLPKPFNGFVMGANITRLFSKTTKYTNFINDSIDNSSFPPATVIYGESTEREISIPGQVDFILNLSLGYEYKGFSIRVSGNYQADYLDTPAQTHTGQDDKYRMAFWRWDLALKQKITQNIEVYFNANNLNNMVETTYMPNAITIENRQLIPKQLTTGPILTYGIRINI